MLQTVGQATPRTSPELMALWKGVGIAPGMGYTLSANTTGSNSYNASALTR
jgi:hypothetical protein